MSRPAPTAAATPEPLSTSSITERWADPPKIRRAPAHAATACELPPAATPIVSANGRYPMSNGSIVQAPLTASPRNRDPARSLARGVVGARTAPGCLDVPLDFMQARVV